MMRKRASGTCPRCQDRSVEIRDEVKAEWRTFHLDNQTEEGGQAQTK